MYFIILGVGSLQVLKEFAENWPGTICPDRKCAEHRGAESIRGKLSWYYLPPPQMSNQLGDFMWNWFKSLIL